MASATTKGTTSRAPGRPSSYNPDAHPIWAQALCETDDATDADLAKAFGVTERTINEWKKKHPEFLQSLKAGKGAADARRVRSLAERADGFRFKTTKTVRKVTQRLVGQGANAKVIDLQEITETVTETFIPPDTTALIFWLKNRDPKRWRDHPEGDGGEAAREKIQQYLDAMNMSKEEVAALFAEFEADQQAQADQDDDGEDEDDAGAVA